MYKGCVFKEFFERVFKVFITLQNYVNAELDADEFKKQNAIYGNRISRNIEYYKKRLKAIQNIDSIFKINSIDSRFFGFYM